jgi:endonuclease YncB( thermonuclease family)
MRFTPLLIAIALATCVPAWAGNVQGQASVINGDTLDIDGTRIRLHGIDAPERHQLCNSSEGEWACGRASATALDNRIGRRWVTCKELGRDRYCRVIASCMVDDIGIESWMTRSWWALAYRRYSVDYVADEDYARRAARGLWAGPFMAPWDWRQARRAR